MAIIGRSGAYLRHVLLQPSLSDVLPSEVDITASLTKSIKLNIPIVSAAMDTVTEGPLAIAMAQAGGIGVIHRNLKPEEQAQHIRKVKKFESGMVVNPVTIAPERDLERRADPHEELSGFQAFGLSRVRTATAQGRLVGILTNRDVRFATNPRPARS